MATRVESKRSSGQARRLWAALLAGVLPATAWAAPVPLLKYTFNDNPIATTAANSGSAATGAVTMYGVSGNPTNLRTASSGGVTGAAGDYAFDATSATGMGGPAYGPSAVAASSPVFNSLNSFTLAGWFNPATSFGNGARLFASSPIVVRAGGNNQLFLEVNFVGSVGSNAVYTAVNDWMFFAVTYDGTKTANNVQYFIGTPASNGVTTASGLQTINQGILPNTNRNLVLANNSTYTPTAPSNGIRPFDGLIDDIALYGSYTDASGALSLADINSVYAATVPEPTTLAVVGVGALALLRRRR